MISYRFVPISSQKGVLFLRHPVYIIYVCIIKIYLYLKGLCHPAYLARTVSWLAFVAAISMALLRIPRTAPFV